tara:strand:+ start:5477 stop:6286 length:810 start_codon:yes stop_codon:yes gene_type:complete
MKSKIIDCVTFFQENYIFNLRYNIISEYVDYMLVCESKYDHRGNKKDLNFEFKKNYNKDKIRYIILEKPFPKNNDIWKNQAIQREFILENLIFVDQDDYIMFSDPDEIPNPNTLINFELKKKYGIFFQKSFNYKLNLFNQYESPWEGTRVCKKKYLKSIDYMRQKIKSKNLRYSFLRIDKEKNIELFDNAGWHFNNLLSPEKISKKLKTFAHSEFSLEKYSSPEIIRTKIENKTDLFDRGHKYQKIELDNTYPKFILENLGQFSEFILK